MTKTLPCINTQQTAVKIISKDQQTLIFDSEVNNQSQLATEISQAIFAHYQFDVPVFVLTLEALRSARQNLPFNHIDLDAEGRKVLLCFLSDLPSNADELLTPYLKSNERLVINGKVLYLHCPDGVGRSKLSHSNIERKLKLNATMRNLKTVDKVINLSSN